jgi:hypothetical protein
MCQQRREHLIRLPNQRARFVEQLAIRKVREAAVAARHQPHHYILGPLNRVHSPTLHPQFSTAPVALWRAFDLKIAFRINAHP